MNLFPIDPESDYTGVCAIVHQSTVGNNAQTQPALIMGPLVSGVLLHLVVRLKSVPTPC